MLRMLTLCLLFCGSAAQAVEVAGPVRVIDGDSLSVGGQAVRLHGIDAPEHDQTCRTEQGLTFACGTTATAAMAQLVTRGPVVCRGEAWDRYDRLVAKCHAGGFDLGAEMVAGGYATAYVRYSRDYEALEQQARAEMRGIWAGAVQSPAAFRARDASPAPDRGCVIKGNISGSGQIYHVPGQEHYARTVIAPEQGERWFCTSAEAEAAGWRAARR